MMNQLLMTEEGARHLPASPLFFGLFTFALLGAILYLVLRLDR